MNFFSACEPQISIFPKLFLEVFAPLSVLENRCAMKLAQIAFKQKPPNSFPLMDVSPESDSHYLL